MSAFDDVSSFLDLFPATLPTDHDIGILDANCGWFAKHASDP